MRWNSAGGEPGAPPGEAGKKPVAPLVKALALLLGGLMLLTTATAADEKQISIFSPVAVYTLPVVDRAGHEYVGLLELLEPLGRVSTDSKGHSLRLHFNSVDAEFAAGKTHAKIHGRDFDFAAPFLIEDSRGLIPLNSLSGFLPRFLGTSVNFHEGARRLIVGESGIQVGFKLDSTNSPRLALNFSSAVNPTISTEPGKLRMVFKRDPVVSPGSQSISFDNKVITQAGYSEHNGDAELDIAANEPLIASFSSDRRTITISAVQPTTKPVGTEQSNPAQSAPSASASPHRVLAVVDPAHGGEERGAALTDKLAEKDVTLGFGRLLRQELSTRGFAVTLLREADSTVSQDQRAGTANAAGAGIYICLHAVSQGSGVGVYTALLPVEGESKGVFHAWNAAQTTALPVSRIVSEAIVSELQRKAFSVRASSASLRPLNNVVMPAVAVELAPGTNGIADLTSANYQQRAAAAIADAIVSVRDRLVVQP
jgi:N-acetylmuramoyl-L-alanine amidase